MKVAQVSTPVLDGVKPCPFCGSRNLNISCGEWFYVHCQACYSSGTKTNAIRFALEAWNKRVGEPIDE